MRNGLSQTISKLAHLGLRHVHEKHPDNEGRALAVPNLRVEVRVAAPPPDAAVRGGVVRREGAVVREGGG